MANDRIKVPGYSQKVFYNEQIEYRNFSPDLVGVQLASDGGTPLFTMGNFAVTTNLEPKVSKNFTTTKFSNFVSLTDLDLTLQKTLELLKNNAGVILNLDRTNLNNYSLFGSLKELVRVSLENIIINWPAALYVNPQYAILPDYITSTGYTVENYNYDIVTNQSSFAVNVNVVNNMFQINYFKNGTISNTFNETNELRNLTINYASYAVSYNNIEYDVLNFTGSTYDTNDYLYFVVKGNPFSGTTNGSYPTYYIKPNKTKENEFFNGLDDFEYYLLNRQTAPIYTALFKFSLKSNTGQIIYTSENVTWPTTDGYNLDFNTDAYEDYASKLVEISTNYDLTTSNLMIRFLVTESITDFDTTAVHLDPLDQDTSGQKMNKNLAIYGVEYDKINAFINGIKFANTVSYNKLDNTPDFYLKNIARVLGWDLISSVLENNLLKNYIQPKDSTYTGLAVGLTAVEADYELWRRLILNTPWLWKSKGSRKSIEFLFKFIGTPLGLIKFNEYIYLAENKIDVDLFQNVLFLSNADPNISHYPIDSNGYPNPLPNTSDLYFQSSGKWYRETGGVSADIDITTGNNPHVGPYDGGFKYINQFRNLIPNFTAVTITSETITTNSQVLFSNYNLGTVTGYNGPTYVGITTPEGVDFSNCYVVSATTIQDPKHRQDESSCGCASPEILESLSICIEKNSTPYDCNSDIESREVVRPDGYFLFNKYQYNPDGSIYADSNGNPILYTTMFIDPTCCNMELSEPYYYNEFNQTNNGPELVNSGYICCQSINQCGCRVTCRWTLSNTQTVTINGNQYLSFIDELGNNRVVSQDGKNCFTTYTTSVNNITDPYTNQVGFGCQVNSGTNLNAVKQAYLDRLNGILDCCSEPAATYTQKIFYVTTNNNTQTGLKPGISAYSTVPTQQNVGGILESYTLSASTQNSVMVGSLYLAKNTSQIGHIYNNQTIRTGIENNPTNGGTLYFNANTCRLGYYVSNTELSIEDVRTTAYNNTTWLPTLVGTIPGTTGNNWNYADFNFTFTGNESYLYLIYDYTQECTGC
jgi:hypothetical protein